MSGLAASWVGRQKKTLRAREQDRPAVAEERDISGREIARIDPSRLVFSDETGILTNRTRRFARAVIGDRACGSAPANWTRLTVLGALSGDGRVGVRTVPNATTAVVFVDVLKTTGLPFLQEHRLLLDSGVMKSPGMAVNWAHEIGPLGVRPDPGFDPLVALVLGEDESHAGSGHVDELAGRREVL
jgi:hypothetical protein